MADEKHNHNLYQEEDPDWHNMAEYAEGEDDEPRTMAYTGLVPHRVERDTGCYLIIEGSEAVNGKRFEVGERPIVVGRSSHCDVVIPDSRVSSRHLEMRMMGDRLMVEDLESSNGTYLNGGRLVGGAVEFTKNSIIQIGQHVLRHEYRSRSDITRETQLAAELKRARSFIEALLPRPVNEGPEQTDWRFIPCAMLGGDAFGYHYLDSGRLAIYLLDVCGHGVGAAMLSVSAVNTIRRQALPQVDFSDPSQVLKGLNRMYQMDDHDGMYFSIWYGVYDRSTRQLVYSSAGHPPALMWTAKNRHVSRLGAKGMAIGVLPDCNIPGAVVTMNPGDRLYLFSDGVYEITTQDQREWSLDEFQREAFDETGPVESEAGRIYAQVCRLSQKAELDDDFSLVVIEFQ